MLLLAQCRGDCRESEVLAEANICSVFARVLCYNLALPTAHQYWIPVLSVDNHQALVNCDIKVKCWRYVSRSIREGWMAARTTWTWTWGLGETYWIKSQIYNYFMLLLKIPKQRVFLDCYEARDKEIDDPLIQLFQ